MRLVNADTALLLGKVGALILVLATAALCWPKSRSDGAMPAEFALIIAALNVIPPYSWYHQMVLLQIPFLTALALAHRRGNSAVLALAAALFVLMNAHGLFWKALAPWPALTVFPLVYSLTLWVVLGYYIADAKWLGGRNSRGKGTTHRVRDPQSAIQI